MKGTKEDWAQACAFYVTAGRDVEPKIGILSYAKERSKECREIIGAWKQVTEGTKERGM